MAKVTYYDFRSADDRRTRVHAVKWEGDSVQPRAVLQLVHGMVEFVERYDAFAKFLTEKGFVVMGHDHIGHGDSVEKQSDWGIMHSSYPDITLVEDIYKNYKIIRKEYPDLPHFILGHSMGSYLLREFLAEKSDDLYDLSGAVIMGTGGVDDKTSTLGLTVLKVLARFFGWDHKSRLATKLMFGGAYKKFDMDGSHPENSWLTKDIAIVKKHNREPRNNFMFSLNGYRALITAVYYDNQPANVAKTEKHIPVFFVSGEDDPVGDLGVGVKHAFSLFKKAGMTDVSMKLYPGDRHEILNETDREKVYADILEWMDSHI